MKSEGLIETANRGTWRIIQAGQTLSSATAAKLVTRTTAERRCSKFLGRVEQVDRDHYFLGGVTKVVLFGSMLTPETERLSDVDLAIEIAKETDFARARVKNLERVEELAGPEGPLEDTSRAVHWPKTAFKGTAPVSATAHPRIDPPS